jgi:dihydropyrimidinase
MQHGSDYTPYEGIEVVGWPVMTLLRGKVIADDGRVVGEAGDGQFLKRQVTASR